MKIYRMTALLLAASLLLAACNTQQEKEAYTQSELAKKAQKAIEESKERGKKATTEKPTSEKQTTEEPSTEAPIETTEVPTTVTPRTEVIATEAPTTFSLTTEAPTTENLATEVTTVEPVEITDRAQLEHILYGNYTEAEKTAAYHAAVSNGTITPAPGSNGTAVQNYEQSLNNQPGQ
ncbi:hypothetical protein [Macrococcus carouselicus]|uniref:Lipoprotein n=1 Tax=Macrococcus carouselicus TaxID=69969 RepID=A0A9Q8CP20_9STAP|nr:hypothetical protein [Macrococcus carouselicus]TDM04125.1 hypothetical protein ERX40_02850 [Macrococcus carouselicus]